ncbi:MAG: sulfate ABC transporter permease subunit CysT [Melioribacteraceae bacterium]
MSSTITLSKNKKNHTLPGFGLTLGFTVFYLSLILIIPLSTVFLKTFTLNWEEFWNIVFDKRVIASYKLSFGTSFIAALINTFFGFIVAWVLVRYKFPGKRIFDSLVDLPFALPTAIAGISLTTIFATDGFWGSALQKIGITVVFTELGIIVALIFIGLPFVVRTIQPVLQDLEKEVEEAAASLNATRWKTFTKIILPELKPAIITGFTLAFARALGEYGSVVFISGNMPMKTEVTSLLIMTKLEQFDYPGATAISVTMLLMSFVVLLIINLIQYYSKK